MMLDRIILISIWVVTIGLLFAFIPRRKFRIAQVAFLFKQLLTWILGLIVVEFGLIEYPVRFFSNENRSSFTFEYFVYPAICAIFNANYPNGKPWFFKLGYYAAFTSGLTIMEVIIENTTNLIRYIHWSWYWSLISLFITFYLSRLFSVWFFRGLTELDAKK